MTQVYEPRMLPSSPQIGIFWRGPNLKQALGDGAVKYRATFLARSRAFLKGGRLSGSLAVFCLASWSSVSAQPGPREILKDLVTEKKTEVLVLATTHLSIVGDRWSPQLVEPLVQALVRFNPDIIAVESMPPYVIEALEKLGGNHEEVVKAMASRSTKVGQAAQSYLALKRLEAQTEADRVLEKLANNAETRLAPEIRRSLALSLLAAYDLPSAALQWSYLDPVEQVLSPALPGEIKQFFDETLKSPNETYSIGVSTARRVGLQRIVSMDDHQEAAETLNFLDQLSDELDASPIFKDLKVSIASFYTRSDRSFEEGIEKGNLLPHYLWLSSPEFAQGDVIAQWGVFLQTHLPSGLDRARLAQWEVRNLRMAAHIRQAGSQFPGGRILVIVGSGHKAFLDHYLSSLIDVELVELASVVDVGAPD